MPNAEGIRRSTFSFQPSTIKQSSDLISFFVIINHSNENMRFKAPQFTGVEDKIFGPLTLKQFIYLAGGVGFGIILYKVFPLCVAILLELPVLAFVGALAFYKPNDMPFIKMVRSAFYYFLKNKLYTWKKQQKEVEKQEEESSRMTESIPAPNLTRSKLKDLAWSLDVKESIYPNE